MKRVIFGCLGVTLTAWILLFQASGTVEGAKKGADPQHVFVYAENQAEDYPTSKAAYFFADQVYEKTGGSIQIVVKCNSELGDEKSVVEQMGFGGIDFSRVSLSLLSHDIPKLAVLMMPYLYSSEEAMEMVLDSEIGEEFKQDISESDNGIRALAWLNAGARSFYTKEKISSVSDLEGVRIRVQQSDIMKDLIQLFGGIPVQSNYSEVYRGLQVGSVDGAENNLPSYRYTGHYEVAGYFLDDEHIRIPETLLVSDVTWQELTEEEQRVIYECAQEAANYEWKLWREAEKDAREFLEKKGVCITDITVEERKEFQEAVQPLYDKYCSDYLELIAEIRRMQ